MRKDFPALGDVRVPLANQVKKVGSMVRTSAPRHSAHLLFPALALHQSLQHQPFLLEGSAHPASAWQELHQNVARQIPLLQISPILATAEAAMNRMSTSVQGVSIGHKASPEHPRTAFPETSAGNADDIHDEFGHFRGGFFDEMYSSGRRLKQN